MRVPVFGEVRAPQGLEVDAAARVSRGFGERGPDRCQLSGAYEVRGRSRRLPREGAMFDCHARASSPPGDFPNPTKSYRVPSAFPQGTPAFGQRDRDQEPFTPRGSRRRRGTRLRRAPAPHDGGFRNLSAPIGIAPCRSVLDASDIVGAPVTATPTTLPSESTTGPPLAPATTDALNKALCIELTVRKPTTEPGMTLATSFPLWFGNPATTINAPSTRPSPSYMERDGSSGPSKSRMARSTAFS
jgi:hypothetical protein